jgi:hypothetical protein
MAQIRLSHDKQQHLPAPGGLAGVAMRVWEAGWPRLKRWHAARKPERRIAVLLEHLHVYFEAADRARADFAIRIANFTRLQLELRHVEVHHWQLCNHVMGTQTALLRASGSAASGAVGHGHFCVSLDSADIRTIIRGIEPSPNLRSSPSFRLDAQGSCILVAGRRELRVPFSFARPYLGIQVPDHIIQATMDTGVAPAAVAT